MVSRDGHIFIGDVWNLNLSKLKDKVDFEVRDFSINEGLIYISDIGEQVGIID